MVAIDFYPNEITRFADVILPPTAHLERSHYDLLFLMFAVHNSAKHCPPVFERGPDQRHDWEICIELATGSSGRDTWVASCGGRCCTPARKARWHSRCGSDATGSAAAVCRRAGCARPPHGVDLGLLEPRLPRRIRFRGRAVRLAPRPFLDDLGRRHLRSNNSWMGNSASLLESKGQPQCTRLANPQDAAARQLVDGELVTLSSAAGEVDVPSRSPTR